MQGNSDCFPQGQREATVRRCPACFLLLSCVQYAVDDDDDDVGDDGFGDDGGAVVVDDGVNVGAVVVDDGVNVGDGDDADD